MIKNLYKNNIGRLVFFFCLIVSFLATCWPPNRCISPRSLTKQKLYTRLLYWAIQISTQYLRGRRDHDRMVAEFTTVYAISAAYRHWCCEFESRSGRGVQHYVIKVCQWLGTGRWFSPGTLFSSSNKTDHHDIAEILLKVALNTIKQTSILLLK